MNNWDGKERRSSQQMFTREEKDNLLQRVNDIYHILTGNGSPEHGLVYKTEKNTDFRMFWERFGWLVCGAVATPSCAVIVMFIFNALKG